ncbi:ATP-dependent Clp protease proteolytic subunit-related protein [Drosera capensis]
MFTLLYMDTIPQPKKRFLLLIDCPGGNVQDGMALYDTLCSLQTPLYTLNMGHAFDIGAYILAVGMKGKRASFPTPTIRLMPLEVEEWGEADYVLNETKELVRLRDYLQAEFAKNTGQPVEKVYEDLKQKKLFNPQQALEYGIIDRIIDSGKYKVQDLAEEEEIAVNV